MDTYLAPTAAIVHSKHFENGIVKLQRGCQESELSAEEREAVYPFRKYPKDLDADFADLDRENPNNDFTTSILANDDQSTTAGARRYQGLESIPTTSNKVERLFSRAKLNLSHLRKSMTPMNLEILLYLHCNRSMWDCNTVNSLFQDEMRKKGGQPTVEVFDDEPADK